MCAIVDANVTFEVFGKKQTEAGKRFRDWLDGNRGQLVVGGKNLTELTHNSNFRSWFLEARRLTGRVRQVGRTQIEVQEEELRRSGLFRVDAKIDSVFITWVRWCSSTWAGRCSV